MYQEQELSVVSCHDCVADGELLLAATAQNLKTVLNCVSRAQEKNIYQYISHMMCIHICVYNIY